MHAIAHTKHLIAFSTNTWLKIACDTLIPLKRVKVRSPSMSLSTMKQYVHYCGYKRVSTKPLKTLLSTDASSTTNSGFALSKMVRVLLVYSLHFWAYLPFNSSVKHDEKN